MNKIIAFLFIILSTTMFAQEEPGRVFLKTHYFRNPQYVLSLDQYMYPGYNVTFENITLKEYFNGKMIREEVMIRKEDGYPHVIKAYREEENLLYADFEIGFENISGFVEYFGRLDEDYNLVKNRLEGEVGNEEIEMYLNPLNFSPAKKIGDYITGSYNALDENFIMTYEEWTTGEEEEEEEDGLIARHGKLLKKQTPGSIQLDIRKRMFWDVTTNIFLNSKVTEGEITIPMKSEDDSINWKKINAEDFDAISISNDVLPLIDSYETYKEAKVNDLFDYNGAVYQVKSIGKKRRVKEVKKLSY
jgi:hypothetical protein